MAPLVLSDPAATGVLAPARRRRSVHGGPPFVPPDDDHGGRGDGGGSDGPAPNGADGIGPFALGLVLAGITTLFLVLIAVWLFLRRPAPDWRADESAAPTSLWLSTVCLMASSVAVEIAARRAGAARRRPARLWLGASLVLGLAFLAAQAGLWTSLWRAGLVPAASGYAAVFFALTGLHALHALGGLGFLGYLAFAPARAPASLRLGAVYWHYMGAIWLVLFALLYFVR